MDKVFVLQASPVVIPKIHVNAEWSKQPAYNSSALMIEAVVPCKQPRQRAILANFVFN